MKIKVLRNIFRDSLIKNSFYLILTSFFNAVLGFFFWIIAARYYNPKDIGLASSIFSASSLISMIGLVGLPTAIVFHLSKKQDNNILNFCLITGTIISTLASIIYIILQEYDLLFSIIFITVTIMISMSAIINGSFVAGRRSSLQMLKDNILNFVKIFPLILFIGFGHVGIFVSIGIGLIIATIIGFFLLYKQWKYIPTLKLNSDVNIKEIASYSFGNYIAGILLNLPRLILPIMIVNIISPEKTGYFYIALTAAGLLYGISISISSSLLAESSDKDKFYDNINKSIKFNMVLLIPGLLIFIIFGKFILNIFSPSYAQNATETFIILSATSIPLSLVNIFNTVRNAQNRVISIIKMNFIVAIITILLAICLIKIMNIEGAAISFLLANIIGALIVIKRIKNPMGFTVKIMKDLLYYKN